ncbi:hypothetical protein JNUCC64_01145 [Streptomyces sp. JNUCC 64]
MSHHTVLRRAVLVTVAVGGVLAPATAALAADGDGERPLSLSAGSGPSPSPVVEEGERATPSGGATPGRATPSPTVEPSAGRTPTVEPSAGGGPSTTGKPAPSPTPSLDLSTERPREGDRATPSPLVEGSLFPDRKADLSARDHAETPRGGVAAGERPGADRDGTVALAGSAAGLLMLAGASTVVLRRRAAVRRDG